MPVVPAVPLRVGTLLTPLRQNRGVLNIGWALSILEQRLREELEMNEGEREVHAFVNWLLEDDEEWMGEDQNDVLDWDGNNDE